MFIGPTQLIAQTDTSPGTALPDDIVDSNGTVVQSAYNSIAYNYANTSGLTYRFGSPADATDAPTLPLRSDIGTISYPSSATVNFQFGAYDDVQFDNYVTSHATCIWKPDSSVSIKDAISRTCILQLDHWRVCAYPHKPWQSPILMPRELYPDPPYDAKNYIPRGVFDVTNAADLPVVQFRRSGPGDGPSTRISVLATQGSSTREARIFTLGTETASNQSQCYLPIGKVPTSIAVTDHGEFAFVTVWDTINFKGQVAVIALASSPEHAAWDESPFIDWWHDFMDMVHPGFRNQGNWSFMKILGYIDLPSNMKAPTSCHAFTGTKPTEDGLNPAFGIQLTPMADNISRMRSGGDMYNYYSKGGLLTVASQSEKTVAFIDLEPLITYFNTMYTSTPATNLETQNVGFADNHWPYPFSVAPASMPTIIKTITLDDRPRGILSTVTYNYWSKDDQRRDPGTPYWIPNPRYPRLWIATEHGNLHMYQVGAYVPGGRPPDIARNPSQISQVGLLTGLGTNITCLAQAKDYELDLQGVVYDSNDGPPFCIDEGVMVVDRKSRSIKWIQFNVTLANTGSVIKTLRDSRMDPVYVDSVDQYHYNFKTICVADFTGKRILGYRHGAFTYDNVTYPLLDPAGEFQGSQTVLGTPFSINTSNVP